MSADIKFCGNCGARLRPGSRFCVECGETVAAFSSTVAQPPTSAPLEAQETVAVAPAAAGAGAPSAAMPWAEPSAPPPGPAPYGSSGTPAIASLGRRALALLIDSLAIGGIFYLVGVLVANTTDDPTEIGFNLTGGPAGIVLLISVVAFLLYFILLEGIGGATLGKMGLGVRVERTSGGPITFAASAVRNVLRIVDALPTAYIVGLVAALTSPRRQRIGDRAAGTVVVRAGQSRPVALLAALGAGVALVAAGAVLRDPASVTLDATMAEGATPDFQPVNPTTRFNPNSEAFHVTFRVTGAKAGSEVRSVWIAVNVGNAASPNSAIDEATITLNDGDESGTFRLRRGRNPWPIGDYKVELFVDGELIETLPFSVAR